MDADRSDLIGYDASIDPCPACGVQHEANEPHRQRLKPDSPLGERIWLALCDCFGHLYDENGRHVTVEAAELAVEICANVESPEYGDEQGE